MSELIGPGPQCMYCGYDYGRHTLECPIQKARNKKAQERIDHRERLKTIYKAAKSGTPSLQEPTLASLVQWIAKEHNISLEEPGE